MFQFRRFPTYTYLIQCTLTEYCSAGFPHSEISGSMAICASPKLIAACHVLHRLLMPRHSPCALISLTYFLSRKKVGKESFKLFCLFFQKEVVTLLVLWVRIMQASDSTKLLFYPLAIKKFHNYVCFPLLLALHTLVTLFSFQGAVLTWSQIQTLVRTNAWIQIQRHVRFSLLPFLWTRKEVVGPSGLEPPTSRLSVVRSSQLSYGPPSWWR